MEDICGNHEHLQKFKRHNTKEGYEISTQYIQTFGGGPEGGYFIQRTQMPDSARSWISAIYSVERTWGTPFTVTLLKAKSCRSYTKDGINYIRIMETDSLYN